MDPRDKLYRIEFFNEPDCYLLASCFSEVANKYKGKAVKSSTLIAATENDGHDMRVNMGETDGGMKPKPLPYLHYPDEKNWEAALSLMKVKGVMFVPEVDPFFQLSQEFRDWQKEWDAHDNGTGPKPKSVDDFLALMKLKYKIENL